MDQGTAGWRIDLDDNRSLRGTQTADGTFTRIYIRYTDPATGESGMAQAQYVSTEALLLMERVVPRDGSAPLSATEAQGLADDAVRLLGGQTLNLFWVELDPERLLQHQDGRRPAKEIQVGDDVTLTHHENLTLQVSGLTPDGEEDSILVSLTNLDPEGFEVAVRLMALDEA